MSVAAALRQAGHNIFLDTDPRDGISPGSEWQRALFQELRMCDAVVFLNSLASQASMWCQTELAVAGELGKGTYSLDLAQGIGPHPLIGARQGIVLGSTLEVSTARLIAQLRRDGLAERSAARWQRNRPPYPGLAAMDIDDAGVFFGREAEVRNLISRVDGRLGQRDGDLVVVIGPSGAGKSSLVRAGLAARLAAPPTAWVVVDPFEPRARPLDRLMSGLVALASGQLSESECKERLSRTDGLATVAEELLERREPRARRLLLTLDQGEQLATVTTPTERDRFLDVLGQGLGAGSPVSVVMTVRSDRLDDIQRLAVIGGAIHEPVVVAPMSRAQLAAVIEGPATKADLRFDAGLVGRLIDDAVRGGSGEFVDALPLLAFTLREMYDLVVKEDRRRITEADYERVGRIEGAIARRAQVAESSLPPDSAPVLEHLLPRFVTLSDEHMATGRPVPRQQLTPGEKAIVERLEDQRLLTGATDESDTIHLAHEQLISAWPTLAKAVAARREDLLLESRLNRQAEDWAAGAGELLGRDAASTASRWSAGQARPGADESNVARYIRASKAALRRRHQIAVGALSIVIALALTAAVVAGYAVTQRNDALAESHVALSGDLAAESANLMHSNVTLEILLALESYALAPTAQAENAVADALEQPLDMILAGGSAVHSVAFSPAGRTVAAGDEAGDVVLWDTGTGKRLATLAYSEGGGVRSLAFSPDGKTLAAGNDNGDVVLWDTVTGKRLATVNDPEEFGPYSAGLRNVYSVAFSPKGKLLAAGDEAGDVVLWDTVTGKRLATVTDPERAFAESVAFSPDGKLFAAGDDFGDVVLWDTATDSRLATLAVPEEFGALSVGVSSVAFSPNGKILAAGDSAGDVVLWNVATHKRLGEIADGSYIYGVAFSPNGQTVATGDGAGNVAQWSTATHAELGQPSSNGSPVYGIAFSPTGDALASGDEAGDIVLWDTTSPTEVRPPLVDGSPVHSVAFSPDGKTIASGDYAGDVVLWDTASGSEIGYPRPEGSLVNSVAFSRVGKTLATGNLAGKVILWSTAGLTKSHAPLLDVLRPSLVDVLGVALSVDGKTLAAAPGLGDVVLWDTASGTELRPPLADPKGSNVSCVAFSPDGKILATGDEAGDVVLWDTATDKRLATLADPGGSGVSSVAFSPDGKILAAGDGAGDVVLWDTALGTEIGQPHPEGSPVRSVAFSPDGTILATGDEAGDVVLWDTARGTEIGQPRADGSLVYSVAFSPDGKTVATGDYAGDVVLWSSLGLQGGLPTLTGLLCPEIRSDLTQAQWAQYVLNEPYRKVCPAYP